MSIFSSSRYDRAAIEQWIHTRSNKTGKNELKPSPKTGQLLEHTILIPNHNLKRLLKDMIREGGESLYYREEPSLEKRPKSQSRIATDNAAHENHMRGNASENHSWTPNAASDSSSNEQNKPDQTFTPFPSTLQSSTGSSSGPLLALVHAKILNCKCLGPPESDWNNRSFHFKETSEETLLGGRRRPHEHTAQNFVQFADATVSRRHFEIRFHDGRFQLRDLGSAGGTFVRIPKRCGVPLKEGTMIMLGKHQLVALEYSAAVVGDEDSDQGSLPTETYQGIDLIEGFNRTNHGDNSDYDDNDLHAEDASDNTDNSGFESSILDQNLGNNLGGKEDEDVQEHKDSRNSEDRFGLQGLRQIPPFVPQTNQESQEVQDTNQSNFQFDNISNIDLSTPLLHLRCFAPEGTPIQNRKYPISRKGATLGRKQSNTISFSHQVLKPLDNDTNDMLHAQHQYVGIDSSISGEHATIQYNNETNQLELVDGVNKRESTNGTWIRLSSMHEESDWFTLDNRSEILIGTVRFEVETKDAVVEKDLYE